MQAALDEGRPERAWDLAAATRSSASLRDRVIARRLLAAIVDRVPAAAWTEPRRRAAEDADLAPDRPIDRIGVMAFPTVDPSGQGRFVEVRVGTAAGDADLLPEGLDQETSDALREALDGARHTLLDARARFSIHMDELHAWRGPSAGLAVALAAVSSVRAQPLGPLLAATGRVSATAQVLGVGLIREKLRLRHEARPHARMLVPTDDEPRHPSALPVATLDQAMSALGVRGVANVAAAAQRALQLDEQGDWIEAARRAEAVVDDPDLTDDERLDMMVLLLAAANHLADRDAADRWSARLSATAQLLDPDEGTEGLARAIGSRAVHRIDALDAEGARRELALAEGRPWRSSSRVHLLGPAALLATLTGDHPGALDLRRTGLKRADVDQSGRCTADLGDALLRVGRPEEALEQVDRALKCGGMSRRWTGYQDLSARYLHLHRARALAALGRPHEARAALEHPLRTVGLDPWLRAALLLAELNRDRGEVEAVRRRLPDWASKSPLLGALLDRSLASLGDPEASARLLAMRPFEGLELAEAARRLPY